MRGFFFRRSNRPCDAFWLDHGAATFPVGGFPLVEVELRVVAGGGGEDMGIEHFVALALLQLPAVFTRVEDFGHLLIEEGVVVLKPNSTDASHRPIVLSDDFIIQGVVVAVLPKSLV